VVHTPQFNGKQEVTPFALGLSKCRAVGLTCAAPATVSGRIARDFASITATERFEHALGKAMEVASTSPDTGQQGGCTLWRATV